MRDGPRTSMHCVGCGFPCAQGRAGSRAGQLGTASRMAVPTPSERRGMWPQSNGGAAVLRCLSSGSCRWAAYPQLHNPPGDPGAAWRSWKHFSCISLLQYRHGQSCTALCPPLSAHGCAHSIAFLRCLHALWLRQHMLQVHRTSPLVLLPVGTQNNAKEKRQGLNHDPGFPCYRWAVWPWGGWAQPPAAVQEASPPTKHSLTEQNLSVDMLSKVAQILWGSPSQTHVWFTSGKPKRGNW